MAKTLNPLSSEGASGSVGPVLTFKRYRGGYRAEAKVKRTDPQSPSQLAYRQRFATCAKYWGTLDQPRVDAWEERARANPVVKDGASLVIPGFDYFCSASLAIMYMGGPPVPFPAPQVPKPGPLIGVNVGTSIPGAIDIVWPNQGPHQIGGFIDVWLQGPLANELRALRRPEQRRVKMQSLGSIQVIVDGLLSGRWYYIGYRLVAFSWMPPDIVWEKVLVS